MTTEKSPRRLILQVLVKEGMRTTQELIDDTGITPHRRLVDNASQARKDGLIESVRDDVTGLMAYKITAKGRQRLADIQAAEQQETEQETEQATESTPAEPAQDVEDEPKKWAGYEYFIVGGEGLERVFYAGSDFEGAVRAAEYEARAQGKNVVVYRAEVVGEAVLSAKFIQA